MMARNIQFLRSFILIVTCSCVTESLLEATFPQDDREPIEYINVELKAARSQSGRSERDLGSCFSKEMFFDTTMDRQDITLDLHCNDDISTNMPVYITGEDGQIRPIPIPHLKDFRWYQDTTNNAAIQVTSQRLPDGRCQYELEGTFTMSKGMYLIQPMDKSGNVTEKNHAVRRVKTTNDFHGDYILTKDLKRRTRRARREFTKAKRQITRQLYTVEVLVVVDNLVFEFWYNRSQATTSSQKTMLAMDSIQRYFAYLMNSVDIRYRSITAADMKFRVHYSGLFISVSAASSPWTSGIATPNSEYPDRPFVANLQSLSSFRRWMVAQRSALPRNDHAMLFTKADIVGSSRRVIGTAYTTSACFADGVSLNEDRFLPDTAITAAHELGHSLGALHDVIADGCDPSDQFIMSGTVGKSDLNPQNHWRFSNCSVQDFREYMQYLNALPGRNCLLNEGINNTFLDTFRQEMPGQFYDIDTQCKYRFGKESFPDRKRYNAFDYSFICHAVYCSIPNTTSYRYITPARGTSCGNRKWCIEGLCVADNRAPSVPDSCPWGDSRGDFGAPLNCHQVAANRNYWCSETKYRYGCCNTCSASPLPTTRQPSTKFPGPILDCPAGDTLTTCADIPRSRCYGGLDKLCCATCYPQKDPSKPGCEYGDRHAECKAEDCHTYNDIYSCCASCPHLRNNLTTASTTTPQTTTTTRPTTTTTNPTTTTTLPPITTTQPTITTPRPTTTTTKPTTTTTLPPITTAQPTTTTTRPTTTTTKPTTTTTLPPITTTQRTTTTTRPTTTTTKPTTTTTLPPITMTQPTTTTTRPTTTTTHPTTTTRPTTIPRKRYCLINNIFYSHGTTHPTSDCLTCNTSLSTTTWSEKVSSVCHIGGSCYADGTLNPDNGCQHCDATKSTSVWSIRQIPINGGSTAGCDVLCRHYVDNFQIYLSFLCKNPHYATPNIVGNVCIVHVQDSNVITTLDCDLHANIVEKLTSLCANRPGPTELPTSAVCA